MGAPAFETYDVFHLFQRETFDRRYFRSERSELFLRGVLDTCSSRILRMPKGVPYAELRLDMTGVRAI